MFRCTDANVRREAMNNHVDGNLTSWEKRRKNNTMLVSEGKVLRGKYYEAKFYDAKHPKEKLCVVQTDV